MFSGLLPEHHNVQLLHLLFVLCHWHGLAKLCLHMDEMLDIFEKAMKDLGSRVHSFVADLCPHFATKELPREAEARQRRQGQQGLSKSS